MTNGTPTEPWLFLMGVPPIEEYLGFAVQAAGGNEVNQPELATNWHSAAASFTSLISTEAGAADNHEVLPLPKQHANRATRFLENADVATAYASIPARLALIPLDGLIVFQRQVNLRYAAELGETLENVKVESTAFFNFCLSLKQPDPPINAIQANVNTFVFSSRSTDARFLGARLLDASHIDGHTTGGRPSSAVVLSVGYGMNAINVLRFGSRLILNNGSHRAYALRESGATHAIAVLQDLSRQEQLVVAPPVAQNPGLYLQHPRPPMLKDYFNESLTDTIDAALRSRQVRVQFTVEPIDAPG